MRSGSARLGTITSLAASALFVAQASAIPSPVSHDHTAATVHWKANGSPALPWTNATADLWNHNHLTADPFDNFQKWKLYASWDNRTYRTSSGLTGNPNFGHGLIEASTPVRYHCDSTVPVDAANEIEKGYNAWTAAALTQFNANKDATDRLAMNFKRDDDATSTEITVVFKDAIADAYAVWNNGGAISFVKQPKVSVATDAAAKRIRAVGAVTNTSSIQMDTPWSFDGDPDRLTDVDLEYSVDSGTNWTTLPPANFGMLTLLAGSDSTMTEAADTLYRFEMDFRTIARHEIGHSIGLDHVGGSGIMQPTIAQHAAFSNTKAIDADSALAAAINYTYSVVPEPTGALSVLAITVLRLMGRRRRSTIAL